MSHNSDKVAPALPNPWLSAAGTDLRTPFNEPDEPWAVVGTCEPCAFDSVRLRVHCDERREARNLPPRPLPWSVALEAAESDRQKELPFRLTGSQKKTAYALRRNIDVMIAGNSTRHLQEWEDEKGQIFRCYVADAPENLNCTGFLTLTVGDWLTWDEAQAEIAAAKLAVEWAAYFATLGLGEAQREKALRHASDTERRLAAVPDDGEQHFCQVWEAGEASRRFDNLNRRILPALFEKAVVVTERHKNGALHFHVVGIIRGRPDIRTGFDFQAFRKAREARDAGAVDLASETRYKIAASAQIRAIWEDLRGKLPGYHFGRSELTPIEKTGEAVAAYVAKYVEKNICARSADDAGKKLVRYIGWSRAAEMPGDAVWAQQAADAGRSCPKRIATQLRPNDFSWGTKRAAAWRCKSRALAGTVGITDREEMAEAFGPRWAFYFTQLIQLIDDRPITKFEWNFAEKQRVRLEVSKLNARHCREREAIVERMRFSRNDLMEDFDAAEAELMRPKRHVVFWQSISGRKSQIVLN